MPIKVSDPVYIPENTRAMLHRALYRATEAGMVADTAVSTVAELGDRDVAKRLKQAGNSINKGRSYSAALSNYGLLTRFDLALLHAGEAAGHISHMHKMLADRYDSQFLRRSRLRVRMNVPVFTAILAMFVIPLPQLFSSAISLMEYFMRSAGLIAVLVVLWKVLIKFYRQYEMHGWPPFITRTLELVPLFRKWLLTSARAEILENLAVLIEAGVPFQQALATCRECADDEYSRRLLEHACRNAVDGAPAAQSLADAKLVDLREGYAIVSTGEAAGKLPESLRHHALACQTYMENVWNRIAEWTPRMIYSVIALIIIKDIFTRYAAILAGTLSAGSGS